jgi:hypothetical protein
MDEILRKARQRISTCVNLRASKQIKFMFLRSIQWYHVYIISTAPHQVVAVIAQRLTALFEEAVLQICDVPSPAFLPDRALIFQPLEDDGLGFLPYENLYKKIQEGVRVAAKPYLKGVGVQVSSGWAGVTTMPSLQWLWRHIASTRRQSRDERIVYPQTHVSWIEVWPNLLVRQLNDLQFVTAMWMIV